MTFTDEEIYRQHKARLISTCRYYKQAKKDIENASPSVVAQWNQLVDDTGLDTSKVKYDNIAIYRMNNSQSQVGEFELYQLEMLLVSFVEQIIAKLDRSNKKDNAAYLYLIDGMKQSEVSESTGICKRTMVIYLESVYRRLLGDDIASPLLFTTDESSTDKVKDFQHLASMYQWCLDTLAENPDDEKTFEMLATFIQAVNTIPEPAYRIVLWKRYVQNCSPAQLCEELNSSYVAYVKDVRIQVNNTFIKNY